MKKLLFLCLLAIVGITAAFLWLERETEKPLPVSIPVTVDLPQGSGIRTLSALLAEKKVIRFPLVVRLAAKIYGYDTRLKAGEYLLEPGMSLRNLLERITGGKVILHRLTLPEGLTTVQMLEIVRNHPLLSGEISETAGEGELLPETYVFHKGAPRNMIIRKAKTAMKETVAEIWPDRAENLPLASPQELVILASIIEKETAVGSERGKVASVFVNRLNKGMPLQTDPTVIYALTLGQKELGRALTRNDLAVDSPYNTYKYTGLPPQPICNPGVKALEAAAHPDTTPYFYFVADGEGGHNFSKSLAEHNRHVEGWIKKRRR